MKDNDGLVDLKRDKPDRDQDRSSVNPKVAGEDAYPYGLTVHLDHDSLSKLGVKTLPQAGAKLHLHAHAHVKSVEERHAEDGKPQRSMSLELRKMRLEHKNSDEDTHAGMKGAMDKALAKSHDEDEGDEDYE